MEASRHRSELHKSAASSALRRLILAAAACDGSACAAANAADEIAQLRADVARASAREEQRASSFSFLRDRSYLRVGRTADAEVLTRAAQARADAALNNSRKARQALRAQAASLVTLGGGIYVDAQEVVRREAASANVVAAEAKVELAAVRRELEAEAESRDQAAGELEGLVPRLRRAEEELHTSRAELEDLQRQGTESCARLRAEVEATKSTAASETFAAVEARALLHERAEQAAQAAASLEAVKAGRVAEAAEAGFLRNSLEASEVSAAKERAELKTEHVEMTVRLRGSEAKEEAAARGTVTAQLAIQLLSRREEAARRLLSSLLAAQLVELVVGAFAAWRDARALGALGRAAAEEQERRAAGEAEGLRASLREAGAELEALRQEALEANAASDEAAQERERAETHSSTITCLMAQLSRREEVSRHLLSDMMAAGMELLVKGAFDLWRCALRAAAAEGAAAAELRRVGLEAEELQGELRRALSEAAEARGSEEASAAASAALAADLARRASGEALAARLLVEAEEARAAEAAEEAARLRLELAAAGAAAAAAEEALPAARKELERLQAALAEALRATEEAGGAAEEAAKAATAAAEEGAEAAARAAVREAREEAGRMREELDAAAAEASSIAAQWHEVQRLQEELGETLHSIGEAPVTEGTARGSAMVAVEAAQKASEGAMVTLQEEERPYVRVVRFTEEELARAEAIRALVKALQEMVAQVRRYAQENQAQKAAVAAAVETARQASQEALAALQDKEKADTTMAVQGLAEAQAEATRLREELAAARAEASPIPAQRRELERLQEELAQALQAAKESQEREQAARVSAEATQAVLANRELASRRILASLLAGQLELLVRGTFSAWCAAVAPALAPAAREVGQASAAGREAIQASVAILPLRREASLRGVIATLLSKELERLARGALYAWQDAVLVPTSDRPAAPSDVPMQVAKVARAEAAEATSQALEEALRFANRRLEEGEDQLVEELRAKAAAEERAGSQVAEIAALREELQGALQAEARASKQAAEAQAAGASGASEKAAAAVPPEAPKVASHSGFGKDETFVMLLTRREKAMRTLLGGLLARELESKLRGALRGWADVAARQRQRRKELAFAVWRELHRARCELRLRSALCCWRGVVEANREPAVDAELAVAAARRLREELEQAHERQRELQHRLEASETAAVLAAAATAAATSEFSESAAEGSAAPGREAMDRLREELMQARHREEAMEARAETAAVVSAAAATAAEAAGQLLWPSLLQRREASARGVLATLLAERLELCVRGAFFSWAAAAAAAEEQGEVQRLREDLAAAQAAAEAAAAASAVSVRPSAPSVPPAAAGALAAPALELEAARTEAREAMTSALQLRSWAQLLAQRESASRRFVATLLAAQLEELLARALAAWSAATPDTSKGGLLFAGSRDAPPMLDQTFAVDEDMPEAEPAALAEATVRPEAGLGLVVSSAAPSTREDASFQPLPLAPVAGVRAANEEVDGLGSEESIAEETPSLVPTPGLDETSESEDENLAKASADASQAATEGELPGEPVGHMPSSASSSNHPLQRSSIHITGPAQTSGGGVALSRTGEAADEQISEGSSSEARLRLLLKDESLPEVTADASHLVTGAQAPVEAPEHMASSASSSNQAPGPPSIQTAVQMPVRVQAAAPGASNDDVDGLSSDESAEEDPHGLLAATGTQVALGSGMPPVGRAGASPNEMYLVAAEALAARAAGTTAAAAAAVPSRGASASAVPTRSTEPRAAAHSSDDEVDPGFPVHEEGSTSGSEV